MCTNRIKVILKLAATPAVIRTDEEKARFTAYIHDNPVKAGLSATPEAWPWSSANRNADIPVGQFQKPLSENQQHLADRNVGAT